MKYIVMLGDGMADYPVEALGGKTPLQKAEKPNMDKIAREGKMGMVKTVPDGMKPGSDVANLAAMGYDPTKCYTGRSPLEAVSMGIELGEQDVAFRCNLVTLSEATNYEDKTMVDYSSDEITTQESSQLIAAINEELKTDTITFYPGISYRHCMVWNGGPLNLDLTPPHDISDREIKDYLPKNDVIFDIMKKSHEILKKHPVNIARVEKGLHPANSAWLWGEGTKPGVENFYELHGMKGSVISAVDLIKGIGICAGMKIVEVEGATGNISTNFKGKGEAALKELLDGQDFVYIHVEAPDECGHRGEIENKVKAIELIDAQILGTLMSGLDKAGEDYSILLMPDHPTPLAVKTHVSDPIPFAIYRSNEKNTSGVNGYDEEQGKSTGFFIANGHELMNLFLK